MFQDNKIHIFAQKTGNRVAEMPWFFRLHNVLTDLKMTHSAEFSSLTVKVFAVSITQERNYNRARQDSNLQPSDSKSVTLSN